MNEFGLKLETIRKKAAVYFPDESSFDGYFFTSIRTPTHSGSECIFDLLTSERSYLPFELVDGETIVLQTEGIMMAALEEKELNRNFPHLEKIQAQICFLTGKTIDGNVYTDLPRTHMRLSDFLNRNQDFFYLEVVDVEYLINSRFVKTVRNRDMEKK